MAISKELLDALPIPETSKLLLPKYIEFLQGPESLKALAGVSEVFLELLDLRGFQDFPVAAESFRQVALDLAAHQQDFGPGAHEVRARRDVAPSFALFRVITAHPIYALLYYQANQNPKALRRLQQGLLTAAHLPKTSALIKEADISSFGLAVRTLTEVSDRWLNAAEENELRSLESIRVAFGRLLNTLDHDGSMTGVGATEPPVDQRKLETLRRQLKDAFRLLNVSTDRKVTRRNTIPAHRIVELRRSLGTRGVSSLSSDDFCEARVLGDADDDTEYPAVHAIVTTPKDADALLELEALGVEPAEASADIEFIFVRHQELPASAQAFSDALRARGVTKRIELQNQFLPLSSQNLNDDDLIHFNGLLKKLDEDVEGDGRDIALLLRVMFATSSPLERALSLQVVREDDFIVGPESVGFDLDKRLWLLPVFPLDLKTALSIEADGYCRNTERQYFTLPDFFGFGRRLVERYKEALPASPFENLHSAEKQIRALFAHSGARLTISRIERFLTLLIAGRFEPVQATYLTGQYLSTSSARRYYTALSVGHYRKVYRSICQDVLAAIGHARQLPDKPDSEEYIGGRYCPTKVHVKTVLQKMRDRLDELRRRHITTSGAWIEFHNLYTAYAIYGQGLLSGVRSVEDPFIGTEDTIKELAIAVFRDKDSENQFHTRTIPLHPLLSRFTEAYGRHREAVLVRLAALNPQGALALRGAAGSSPPFVFLLGPKGHWQRVRPSGLKPILEPFTPLPLNSNRKLLRTHLIEKGVSPHAVDTLLGHASRGEPFWGAFASRSFRDMSAEILAGLDGLASAIDLQVEPGLAV